MMKHRSVTFLLTLLMSMVGTNLFAHDIEVANSDGKTIYYFWMNNKTELAVGYKGNLYKTYSNEYSGNIVIPESVSYNGTTYPVTCILEGTFYNCSGVTSITIPNSVTSIERDAFVGTAWYNNLPNGLVYAGKVAYNYKGTMPTRIVLEEGTLGIAGGAFYGCSGLTSITIPDGVTSIGSHAFEECSSLTSITIPDGVTSIGENTFFNCNSLNSITIPNSVTIIYVNAFNKCYSLTSVHISDLAAWCNIFFCGIVANPLSFAHHLYLNGKEVTNIIIPDGITSIDYTFCRCSGLTSITIPNSVTSIGERSFEQCSRLTSVTIPNSVTSIGNYAFADCSGLTSVTIGNSVTSIGEKAFYECSRLASIMIPLSVTSIGASAFSGCRGLSSITIPNSVTAIGEQAFRGCWNATTLKLPDNLQLLRQSTFSGCSKLKSVTIPSTVEVIYQNAFEGCTGLESVTSQATNPPFLYDNSFSDYSIPLNVPSGCKSAYEDAQGWRNFTNISDGNMYYQLRITATGQGAATYNNTQVRNTTATFDVKEGNSAVITISPDNGYAVSTATINGEDATAAIVNGALTISNMSANTTVAITFARASATTVITLENDMQTYCPLDDVDFSNVAGLKAFTATGYDHGTLTVSRVLNAPAGTGLLLQGTAGVTYQVPYATQTGYYINLLHGLTHDTQVSPTAGNQTNFLLGKKNGVTTFYRVAQTGTVSAGKAYLQLPTSVVGDLTGSRVMRIVADDETTGISEALPLNDNGEIQNDNVYDLQGRRVTKPTRGLYIVNGKKVVIK